MLGLGWDEIRLAFRLGLGRGRVALGLGWARSDGDEARVFSFFLYNFIHTILRPFLFSLSHTIKIGILVNFHHRGAGWVSRDGGAR